VWRARQQGQEQTGEKEKGVLQSNLPEGRQAAKGQEVYVPKDAVERIAERSIEIER
jgi:hypothetical protein